MHWFELFSCLLLILLNTFPKVVDLVFVGRDVGFQKMDFVFDFDIVSGLFLLLERYYFQFFLYLLVITVRSNWKLLYFFQFGFHILKLLSYFIKLLSLIFTIFQIFLDLSFYILQLYVLQLLNLADPIIQYINALKTSIFLCLL